LIFVHSPLLDATGEGDWKEKRGCADARVNVERLSSIYSFGENFMWPCW